MPLQKPAHLPTWPAGAVRRGPLGQVLDSHCWGGLYPQPVWNVIPRGAIFQPILCPQSPSELPEDLAGHRLQVGKTATHHITFN